VRHILSSAAVVMRDDFFWDGFETIRMGDVSRRELTP
jgi:hypothetical protein